MLDRFSLALSTLLLATPALAQHAHHDHQPMMQGAADDETLDELMDLATQGKKNAIKLFWASQAGAKLDAEKAYTIGRKEIEVPLGKLILEGGWVIPASPKAIDPADAEGIEVPERQYVSAVYLGEGRFEYTPPNDSERWIMNFHLSELNSRKYTDLDKLDVGISGGVAMSFNGKWRALLEEGSEAGAPDKKVVAAAEKLHKARGELLAPTAALQATSDEFNGTERNFLMLDVGTKDLKGAPAITYNYDPSNPEAVDLGVYKRYALNRDVISGAPLGRWFAEDQSQGRSDLELGYARLEQSIDCEHYVMDMTIYKDERLNIWGMKTDGSMRIKMTQPTRTFEFGLLRYANGEPFKLHQLTYEDGTPIDHVHIRAGASAEYYGGSVLVDLGKTFEAGEVVTLKFKTEGLVVDTIAQPPVSIDAQAAAGAVTNIINYRLPIGAPWFPAFGNFTDAFTFDWTLRLPKPMTAATSGTMMNFVEQGDMNVLTIRENVPVFFPAIVFGRFTARENDPDYSKGEKKIRVFMHPGFDKEAQTYIDEAEGVIAYYTQLFQKEYPWPELDIVQMPLGVGYAQAPSGLVQMDGAAFIPKTTLVNVYQADDNMLDIRDNFVPHEIAHFWWGHIAGWADSRDQWASETLAEYTAALYIEERAKLRSGDRNDMTGYDHRKGRWGAQGRRGHTFKRTGPLWVGNRTGSRRTSTVYARGPLIMDMLRDELGYETLMNFLRTLNHLSSKHEGKLITEDVQVVLEKVVPGVKFDQFVEAYIKGNAPLPTDPNAKKAAKQGKSKY
jgi:hypothetical protein